MSLAPGEPKIIADVIDDVSAVQALQTSDTDGTFIINMVVVYAAENVSTAVLNNTTFEAAAQAFATSLGTTTPRKVVP